MILSLFSRLQLFTRQFFFCCENSKLRPRRKIESPQRKCKIDINHERWCKDILLVDVNVENFETTRSETIEKVKSANPRLKHTENVAFAVEYFSRSLSFTVEVKFYALTALSAIGQRTLR